MCFQSVPLIFFEQCIFTKCHQGGAVTYTLTRSQMFYQLFFLPFSSCNWVFFYFVLCVCSPLIFIIEQFDPSCEIWGSAVSQTVHVCDWSYAVNPALFYVHMPHTVKHNSLPVPAALSTGCAAITDSQLMKWVSGNTDVFFSQQMEGGIFEEVSVKRTVCGDGHWAVSWGSRGWSSSSLCVERLWLGLVAGRQSGDRAPEESEEVSCSEISCHTVSSPPSSLCVPVDVTQHHHWICCCSVLWLTKVKVVNVSKLCAEKCAKLMQILLSNVKSDIFPGRDMKLWAVAVINKYLLSSDKLLIF